jgi:hypothetical protein
MHVECPDMSEITVTGFLPGKSLYPSSLEFEDKPFPEMEKDRSSLEVLFEGEEFSRPKKEKADLFRTCEDSGEQIDSGTVFGDEIGPEAG